VDAGLRRGTIKPLGPSTDWLAQVTSPPKRPRDFSQAAKLVIDIASGQVEDREPTPEEQGKDAQAVSLGQRGGKARAAKLSPKRREEIAKKAARKRWATSAARDTKEPS
jgi:hypothetical protein